MPIPNILGKVASMMLGQGDATQGVEEQIREARFSQTRREAREGIHCLLLEFQTHLLNAVSNDIDVQPIVQGFIQMDVPLKEKYITLHVTELLKKNSESVEGLKHIHSGLGTIIKYAKHLIKENRQEQWGTISFKNPIVQRKILPLNGFPQVLHQLGYTEVTEFGQSFPQGKEPNKDAVIKLIADMELFRGELKNYCSGRHSHPQNIEQYLPQHLRDEIKERQVADVGMMESNDTWTGPVSAVDAKEYPNEAEGSTKLVTAAPLECNKNVNGDTRESCQDTVTSKETPGGHSKQAVSEVETSSSNQKSSEHIGTEEKNNVDESKAIPDLVPCSISETDVTGACTTSETPSDISAPGPLTCSVCGEEAVFLCRECYTNQMALCEICNKNWHKRQDRRHHNPQPISQHHRLSLESSSSGHTGVHFDEHYGITAASKQGRSRQEQTSVVNVSKLDHQPPPLVNDFRLHDTRLGGLGLPQDKQAMDLQAEQPVGHHGSPASQYHLQPLSQPQVSQNNLVFQQGHLLYPQHLQQPHMQQLQQQQHGYQNYNNLYQQPHQMTQTYRMPSPYNPPVNPSFVSPSTPSFSPSRGISTMMSSATSSKSELGGMPQQLGGQGTLAGQMYQTPNMAGMLNAGGHTTHPLMTMTKDNQGGIEHQYQPQHLHQQPQQRPLMSLPSYVQSQLEHNTHVQIPGPRWAGPGSQASPYNPYMTSNFQQHFRPGEQQVSPRLAYPQIRNHTDLSPQMFATPPSHLNIGSPQPHQQAPYISQNHNALNQSMFLQNHQRLQYPVTAEKGFAPRPMDQSLQQGNAQDMSAAGGTFAGLNKSSNDMKFVCNDKVFRKSESPNCPRDMRQGSRIANISAQENFQQVQPVASPCQSPFVSASSSPLSTPPPPVPASSSEYIKKLSMEPDLTKRINMCDNFIRNITADIAALDEDVQRRMAGPGSFFCTPACGEMQRRKEEMVKEKKRLQSFKDDLNCQINHFYKGMESSNIDQEIYYPPDINMVVSSKSPTTKHVYTCFPNSDMNIVVSDNQKILNVVIDNTEPAGLPAHLTTSAAQASVSCGSRVPVEDSISENICDPKDPKLETPPALPPRSSKPVRDKDILNMTIPAPKISRSPSPTTQMWVCQHCTLLNPINLHICQVCYRTSDNAELVNASADNKEADDNDSNGRNEINQPEVACSEKEAERSNVEDQEKDTFVAILTDLQDKPKRPPLFDEDDDDVGDELWENEEAKDEMDKTGQRPETMIGERIIGSQKQVMEEKKRAKKEFELKEQQQLQQQRVTSCAAPNEDLTSSEESKSTNHSNAHSSSATNLTHPPPFGVGARPKDSNRLPINIDLPESTNDDKKMRNLKSPHNTRCSSPESGHLSGSLEDSLARMEVLKSIDSLQASGAQLIQLIKMADLEDFDIQAVQIAIEICESMKEKMDPLAWLRSNWRKNVTKVASQARKLGQGHSPNSVGEISFQEAEVAYISCQGNMKEAAEKCVQDRQAVYEKLSALAEDFPREEILEALFYCKGDEEAAQARLIKAKVEPFANRIWQQQSGTPAALGTVTESVVSTAPTTTTITNGFTLQGPISSPGTLTMTGSQTRAQGKNDANSRGGAVNMVGVNAGVVDPYQCFATSVIGHQQFQDMMRDKSVDTERRVRMIYVEGRLHSWGRADMVIKILDQDTELQHDLDDGNVTLEDIVEAVRDCQDRTSALAYLRQECQICFGRFPMNKIHNLNICQCRLCQECLVSHFEVAIREKHVRHWVCPQCSQPDLRDLEMASNYLQFLGMQLQPMVSQDLHDLFETKFRDWHLQTMDYFRWCAHCAEGFLAENQGEQLKMTCPRCGKRTCFKCKKQWEDQHEGLTCEQFSQWKVDNDPTNQSVGLAKHLDENGIDCPNCKMRFALAKGGCMHFKCPQCGHEFCSGCNESYHHKNMCTKYRSCKTLGLHCHCPRDCFSFLRDYTVDQLQGLLKQHNVPFNIAAPADQQDPEHCPVMEQKEFDGEGNRDEMCGRDALQGGAGLCEIHYKEYLVVLINGQGLDPVSYMTIEEMEAMLKRYDLPTPPARSRGAPEVYKGSLVKIIKEKLPLKKR